MIIVNIITLFVCGSLDVLAIVHGARARAHTAAVQLTSTIFLPLAA